jgi:hypothetical protein
MNLLLCTRLKGQKRWANCGMSQDTPSNKSMFQSDSALHVRSTVIDTLSDGQELIMDFSCLLIVLGFASLNELNERLGCDVAVANQEAVNVK